MKFQDHWFILSYHHIFLAHLLKGNNRAKYMSWLKTQEIQSFMQYTIFITILFPQVSFFFLNIIDLYFLTHAIIAKIFNPIVEVS